MTSRALPHTADERGYGARPLEEQARCPLPDMTKGYGLGPGEGEALWFNRGFALLKATGDQTAGRFTAMGLAGAQGIRLAAPHPPSRG